MSLQCPRLVFPDELGTGSTGNLGEQGIRENREFGSTLNQAGNPAGEIRAWAGGKDGGSRLECELEEVSPSPEMQRTL